MYSVELYSRVRRACHVDGMSKSAAARHFGIDRKTVSKILKHAVPPGYRRNGPPARPKLDPFIPLINQILEEDKSRLKKQRHTSKRIYERLRDEHGFVGGITIVTDYVRERKRRTREVFVPLSHAPGHAQVDFGEALGEIGGVVRKLHYFAMSLPHSDAFFIKAYPAETTEAFCDGHVSAFAFFGGVPLSGLYDNTTIAVARILGDGTRQRTRTFAELQSHYLFEDRFGRPGKGNDKGNVEGTIGYGRRNFLVPMPRFDSFDDLNARLEEQCLKRQDEVLRGHSETIGERLMRDLDALRGHRLRCSEASRPLPDRETPTPARSGDLPVPSKGAGRDHRSCQLHEPDGAGTGMTDTPQVLLQHHLKKLRLPTFHSEYAKQARQCAVENKDHINYLLRLCELELIERERRMIERRIKAAKFPATKSLDSFNFKVIPSLNKVLTMQLARGEFIDRRANIIALGPSGTGKTHIALGLGLAACQKGRKVRFTTAAALVHELIEAVDERRLQRLQKQLVSQDLLIIDELGFVPLSKTGAELLFEIISQRYERGSIIITSNLPFDEWTEVFGAERLTGAILDRLTHHVRIPGTSAR